MCCVVQIAFPQAVELQYVEVSSTKVGKSLQVGSLQVYGRMGECDTAHTFIELTDGPTWLDDGPVLLDAQALQTERLVVRGDCEEVTVRAIGTFISFHCPLHCEACENSAENTPDNAESGHYACTI